MGPFKDPDLAGMAVSALFPEQFQIDAVRGHTRRSDGHKFIARPGAGIMDQARDQFLTRSWRARDQDAAIGLSDLSDQLTQLLGRCRVANKPIRRQCLLTKAAVLALQIGRLQCPLDHQ